MADLYDAERDETPEPTYRAALEQRASAALDLLFIHADGHLGTRTHGLDRGGVRIGAGGRTLTLARNSAGDLLDAVDELRFDLAHLADAKGIDPRALGAEWGADDLYESDQMYWAAADRAASAVALQQLGIRRGPSRFSDADTLQPRGLLRRLGDTLINGNLDRDGLSEADFAYVQHHMYTLDAIDELPPAERGGRRGWQDLIADAYGLTHVLEDLLAPELERDGAGEHGFDHR